MIESKRSKGYEGLFENGGRGSTTSNYKGHYWSMVLRTQTVSPVHLGVQKSRGVYAIMPLRIAGENHGHF